MLLSVLDRGGFKLGDAAYTLGLEVNTPFKSRLSQVIDALYLSPAP